MRSFFLWLKTMVSLIVIRVFLISKLILIISLNTADWHKYLDVWVSNVNYFFPGTLNNSFFTMLKYFQLLLVCFVTYYFWSCEWKPDVWLIKSKLNRGTHLLVGMCTYSRKLRVEERHNNPSNLVSQLISCHDIEKLPARLISIQLTYFGLSWHYY